MKERILELIKLNNLKELKVFVNEAVDVELAEVFDDMPIPELAKTFRLLSKDNALDVFAELEPTVASDLLEYLSDKEAVGILNELSADDATDILEEMPANLVDKLLKKCNETTRKDVNKLLNFKEDSAGSIMTVEYAEFKEDCKVRDAIEILRTGYEDYETINTCFVLDKKRKLVGYVNVTDLLFAKKNDFLEDICNKEIISVYTSTDQEEVAIIFQKYDVTVLPVVDSEDRLVGIVTIDDIMDVVEEEATEDMKKMAAIIPIDKPYDKVGVLETVKARIPWLLLLMISATFTGKIISSFEDSLATMPLLTAFIPMLMDTGGNAGGQASVSIIRALSLKDIEFKDIFKVIWKEFRVALLCAIVLGICNFIKLLIIDQVTVFVAGVVCLTLIATVIIAKFIGCTLPMVAKRVGFDPAVMASPFITTIVDACSLLIYFAIASSLLGL